MSDYELPSVELDEVDPVGAVSPTAPADIAVYLGCAPQGTLLTPLPFGAQDTAGIEATFLCGPLCREGGYQANKTPAQTVLSLDLNKSGYFASAVANPDFAINGHVVVNGKTYDGPLLTAVAEAFGFSDTITGGKAEFDVELGNIGGKLAAMAVSPPCRMATMTLMTTTEASVR